VGFLCLWCRDTMEVVGRPRKLVMEDVVGVESGYMAEVEGVDWRCTDNAAAGLRLLPLVLLAKDLDVVLQLCKPSSLYVYVLPSGLGVLSYGLSTDDGFLFLVEVLDLVLNPGKLCFRRFFILEGFVFPIFHLDLLKLYISLDELYWRRCPHR
jgi:hypothetical protein